MGYILALDQGTTSSRAILFNQKGEIVSSAFREVAQIYPQAGWVEHNPAEIWNSQISSAKEAVIKGGISPREILTIGITNQRETTILWDRLTGEPLYNAIVWQCRRSSPLCHQLKAEGFAGPIRKKTGLVVDAYFSATKIKWLIENIPEIQKKAKKGEALFGTVNSWLLYQLTGKKVHATDYSNASRTMLFNIHKLSWDQELLERFGIPVSILPEVKNSSEIYGYTHPDLFEGVSIPISGMAGDQHAALFGQGAFQKGSGKNTYGTGCFLLMNTGDQPVVSKTGLLTTIAWGLENKITYALEGSVFIGGAVIQWLRDELKIIQNAAESEDLALSLKNNGGVYLVPAFVGLGAPYWDMEARGIIVGLTRGAGRAHIARAALESIAYQVKDLMTVMEQDSGFSLQDLRVDGGAVKNNFLMQFQSDMINTPLIRPKVTETTAMGAAYLAGLAVGFWKNLEEIQKNWQEERRFLPSMGETQRNQYYNEWKRAVEKSR
ncbi:MAG: glycerol kinase GlpK [Nitrospirae bacterium]|nr:glycerol kinase GlpK [Nitrospirota bacterium]MBI3351860.1 glycerol kinase GlpK [Nitrospirota bacterium]